MPTDRNGTYVAARAKLTFPDLVGLGLGTGARCTVYERPLVRSVTIERTMPGPPALGAKIVEALDASPSVARTPGISRRIVAKVRDRASDKSPMD